MQTSYVVRVYFDLICPWCLIGKRHLDEALAQFRRLHPELAVVVDWRSHALLPDTPLAGLPYQEFYERRLGSPEAVARRRAQVRAAAQAAGLELAFDRIAVMPNTAAAHRLIQQTAQRQGPVAALIEQLFCAYFMDGRDIGDPAVLADIASAVAGTADEPTTAPCPALDATAAEAPVNGVPFFIFNDRLAVSGAYPAATLLAALEQTLEAEPAGAAL